MNIQRVYFMLMAQEMDRAVEFYRDAMGLEVRLRSGGWSELGWGDAILALHAGGDGRYRATGLGFGVSDVAEACARVNAQGGSIVSPPEERAGEGIILAQVADPEGNGFSLSQRVG